MKKKTRSKKAPPPVARKPAPRKKPAPPPTARKKAAPVAAKKPLVGEKKRPGGDDGVVGQGQGSGWSGNIGRRGAAVLDWIEGLGPPVGYEPGFDIGVNDLAQTSDNHEAGLWGIEAMRAAQALLVWGLDRGARERWRTALDALLNKHLARELDNAGLGGGECLTPDSHTHQHLWGVMAARAAAVISGDKQALERTGELVLRWARMLRAVSTPYPGLFVGSAGFRSPHTPVFFAASAWLRQLAGLPGPMPEFAKNPDRNWSDPFSLHVRILRWLQGRGRDSFIHSLAGEDAVQPGGCKMKYEMVVYRSERRGHLVVIPPVKNSPRPVKQVCDWALVPHDAKSLRQLTQGSRFGFDWQTPPPDPPPGAQIIRFGPDK